MATTERDIRDERAAAIMQAVLDKLTTAIWERRPSLLRENTTNPHAIFTKEGKQVFHHDTVLDQAVFALGQSVHSMGVDTYLRTVTRARFVNDNVIEGQYRSWFLRDLMDVYPSFDAHMVLVRDGSRFIMSEARNNIDRDQWPLLSKVDGTDAVSPASPVPPVAKSFDDEEFDRFLEDISQPFISKDITRWRNRILLPFSIVTTQGPATLTDDKAVQRNFELYLTAVTTMKLDSVLRLPIRYEVCDDDTVIATYRTELLSHGQRQIEPYTASALLHRTPDGWKMSSIMNALGHHRWTGQTPNSNGDEE